jgi:ADP-ribose pyrophosphatase YjhB (NUDIX family)
MSFEPEKFFIGLMDFFSILLPGALLTYLLRESAVGTKCAERCAGLAGAEGWAVFLFSAYLLGHFIFLLGSLLDGWIYDPLRASTTAKQVERIASGKKLSPWLPRRLAVLLFKPQMDDALHQAVRIKDHYLEPLAAASAINAFQWSKVKLTLDHREAMISVQRFEADSKFFRSLLVLLLFVAPFAVTRGVVAALASLVIVWLAFWRYVDQRSKATTQAYWYVIALEGGKQDTARPMVSIAGQSPSHAGGVVFRKKGTGAEYLLVRANSERVEWVLPKGHVERGESERQAAVREVHEEARVWAAIRATLEPVELPLQPPITVQFFLMEALEEGKPPKERKRKWLSFENALKKATHPETVDLLKAAEEKRRALAEQPSE